MPTEGAIGNRSLLLVTRGHGAVKKKQKAGDDAGLGNDEVVSPSENRGYWGRIAVFSVLNLEVGSLGRKDYEPSFVADVTGWINSIIENRRDLPFRNARVEESAEGKRTRRDVTLYDLDGNKALTGEVKMPDAPDGKSPYAEDVVQDAFQKASDVGARYFFTWNVNRLVLWDPSKVKLPILQRQARDYAWFTLKDSVAVTSPGVIHKLRTEYLPKLLENLAAIYRGETPFGALPPDERFILMLEAFLERPVELTRDEIYQRWHSDKAFRGDLSDWMVKQQKWTIPKVEAELNDLLDRAAKLSCYVLANKLIFYEALRNRFSDLKPITIPASVDSVDRMYGHLTNYFESAQRVTDDYETIFWPDYGAKVPLFASGAIDAWKSIISQIGLFKLGSLQYDVLGPIFQRLIDKDSKHKYGQHYTQPTIVDVINAFTIRRADTIVMDPGCGSGTFLIRAYARKRWMNPSMDHATALSQLYGVDWSGFAVHLAALGLASQDMIEADNYPRVVREDFFDVAPEGKFMTLPQASKVKTSGLGSKHVEIGMPRIDAGVGNPPYIRQEEIDKGRKKAYQKLVKREAPGLKFSGRSDIYVYFWPHLGTFLKTSGMMGLLTSSTWLDVDYGFRLQDWLLENFKIIAILESVNEPWFEGARVQTAVTIVEPCATREERNPNKVRFVQLRVPLADLLSNDGTEDGRQKAAERVRDLILATAEDTSTDQYRILVRSQEQLFEEGCKLKSVIEESDEGSEEQESEGQSKESMEDWKAGSKYKGSKWGVYLRAPDFYFDLMEKWGTKFTALEDLAAVRFGVKSGCDAFFFPTDHTTEALKVGDSKEFKKRYHGVSRAKVVSGKVKIVRAGDGSVWPIESKFLEREVHNLMPVDTFEVKLEQLNRFVLLVNKPKARLKKSFVLKYIEYGEHETFGGDETASERSTCRARKVWYDLTGNPRGDALWPMTHKYRHLSPWNPDKFICNHRLFSVRASNCKLAKALTAVLNSTLVAFLKHFYGRYAGMEHTLDTEIIDVDMLPVPDLEKASAAQLAAVEKAFEKMKTRKAAYMLEDALLEMIPVEDLEKYEVMPPELPEELREADRQELDRAVLTLVGVPDAEISAVLNSLYSETTLIYRRGRLLDIRTARNKRSTKKGASISASEVADAIWENLPPSALKSYPIDFVNTNEDVDHYSLPKERGKLIEDMFHNPRLKFKSDEIEFRNREQAQLALSLLESGVSGTLSIPADSERCEAVREAWEAYVGDLTAKFDEEISHMTPDEAKVKTAKKILMRRLAQYRPGKHKVNAVMG